MDKNASFDDPVHGHERDIICHKCESGISFDKNQDTLGQVTRDDGVWVSTKCPACLSDVPLHRLDD